MAEVATVGRPSKFTQDLADSICSEIAIGKSLRKICEGDEFPTVKTVFNWLRTDEAFLQQYTRAREEQAESYADEIIDIADTEADPNKARVRVDSRKWVVSKLLPKKYGDKLDVTTMGKELPTPLFGGMAAKPEDTKD